MRRAETVPRTEQGAPGKPRPAVIAFDCPRPRLLRDFTKERLGFFSQKTKPSDGNLIVTTRGLVADAFFGASPVVASALGVRLGATPRGHLDSNTQFSSVGARGDISTLLRWGHFYFAATLEFGAFTRQNGWNTMKALERRIGQRRDATRPPTRGPEWRGGSGHPKDQISDSVVPNLLEPKNGLDFGVHLNLQRTNWAKIRSGTGL